MRGYWYDYSPASPLTRGGGGTPEGFVLSTKTIKNEIKSILSNPLNRVVSFGQDNLLNRT